MAERDCLTSQRFALEGDIAATTVSLPLPASAVDCSGLNPPLPAVRSAQRLLIQVTTAKDDIASELSAAKAELENAKLSIRAAVAERDAARSDLTALKARAGDPPACIPARVLRRHKMRLASHARTQRA